MRRRAVAGALVVAGVLIVRARMPALHGRLTARCERMFDRMPDTFPPKKMLRGIEEIRVTTARIQALLEAPADRPFARGAISEEHQEGREVMTTPVRGEGARDDVER